MQPGTELSCRKWGAAEQGRWADRCQQCWRARFSACCYLVPRLCDDLFARFSDKHVAGSQAFLGGSAAPCRAPMDLEAFCKLFMRLLTVDSSDSLVFGLSSQRALAAFFDDAGVLFVDCDQLFKVLDPVIGERHHPLHQHPRPVAILEVHFFGDLEQTFLVFTEHLSDMAESNTWLTLFAAMPCVRSIPK